VVLLSPGFDAFGASVTTATVTASRGQLGTGDKTIVASYAGAEGFTPSAGLTTVTESAINSEVVPSVEPSPVYKRHCRTQISRALVSGVVAGGN
jgi:hypothetical protein